MRALLAAATAALLIAAPAIADETTGTVAGWDPLAGILTLTDRTVWPLGTLVEADMPVAGNRITIQYQTAGEDGLTGIESFRLDR